MLCLIFMHELCFVDQNIKRSQLVMEDLILCLFLTSNLMEKVLKLV